MDKIKELMTRFFSFFKRQDEKCLSCEVCDEEVEKIVKKKKKNKTKK